MLPIQCHYVIAIFGEADELNEAHDKTPHFDWKDGFGGIV